MSVARHVTLIVILFTLVRPYNCWDNEDLEIFDAVEEINKNFYELLNVAPDCDSAAIRKAFRRLSLILHPDKNESPDAESEFRKLVSVYDILKDPNKRSKYDLVLKNGLPNWKSAVYYYRHVRKVGILELMVILLVLISVGQYAVGWASYWEAKLNLESKKNKPIEVLEKPCVLDTLPIQIPKLVWFICLNLPFWAKDLLEIIKEKLETVPVPEPEPQRVVEKVKKKKKVRVLPERDYEEEQVMPVIQHVESKVATVSGGLWTDDDLSELSRLTNKYPAGTPDRWEKISNIMLRPVSEITHMALKIRDNPHLFLKNQEEIREPSFDVVKKTKTKAAAVAEDDGSFWTQDQQKSFENALIKYPKKSVADRWEKIANCVSGKTKDECILRYKYLVELVVKSKNE